VFVAVDGPNGVGKTTIAAHLAEALRDRGHDVLALRQPSDSDLGRFVRTAEHGLRGLSLAILVVADRLVQVATDIRPALKAGRTVICDRHVASTLVLQRLDGMDVETIWQMNADVPMPDLQVILLASPEVLKSRLDERGRFSRFERSGDIEELEVRYYREAAEWLRAHGQSVLTIETDRQSVGDIAAAVIGTLGA
jgi:dTMP kinase